MMKPCFFTSFFSPFSLSIARTWLFPDILNHLWGSWVMLEPTCGFQYQYKQWTLVIQEHWVEFLESCCLLRIL